MLAAITEGRGTRRGFSLKSAIGWVFIALAYVLALSFYKDARLDDIAAQGTASLRGARHSQMLNLFQATYYFYYDDQFLPGVRKILESDAPGPRLERIEILSNTGAVIFDSDSPKKQEESQKAAVSVPKEVQARLGAAAPSVFVNGYDVQVLIPSGQYGVLYTFDGHRLRPELLLALLAGLFAIAILRLILVSRRLKLFKLRARYFWRSFWRLRVKLLLTIVSVNVITGIIVFFTLSSLQTRELTRAIEKDSVLFAQFSTAQVSLDFTNFFYFSYTERFLPEIRKLVASNENLDGIRIISRRTNSVLFDSERAAQSQSAVQLSDLGKVELPAESEEQLKTRDLVVQHLERRGSPMISVINTYRNENQEPLFWIEYLFSFHTLNRNIRGIRSQILLDLIPAMVLGLLVAVIFAQFLISPIRKLMGALQRVAAGEYDVSVDLRQTDEIGELVTAFNSMTTELRKKKELRKYLSDSTYRQIMEAPDSPDGIKLGGTRVAATVLFSDIRNFVAHCEMLDAEEITAMLNRYFSEMVEVVYKHGGEVDKFIGDALLAVFYTGENATDTATSLQAINCALEMRERLSEFNLQRRAEGKKPIEIGVGITHGDIISGPIGSKDRMDFTVIGDVVNVANRIEKLSKAGRHTKIVFSNHVESRVRGLLDYEELTVEKIRGKEEEVHVFELIGVRDLESLVRNLRSDDIALKRRSVQLLGICRNLDAIPFLLEGLQDLDELCRVQAAVSIAKLAPRDMESVIDALFERLEVEGSDRVLSALVTSIGKLCSGPRILDLARFLDSPNERIVANTVESLGQANHPRCNDLILPKLNSRNNRIKANAAMALFSKGHVEVIDILKPMLMHSDPLMRSSAAFAIGELTMIAQDEALVKAWRDSPHGFKLFLAELQECVPMLVTLLKDPDLLVKRQAVIALGKIRDKSAVLPIIELADTERMSKEILRDVSEALRAIGSHKLVREVISRLT